MAFDPSIQLSPGVSYKLSELECLLSGKEIKVFKRLLQRLQGLLKLLGLGPKPGVRIRFFIHNYPGQRVILEGENMLVLTDVQKVALSIQPVDSVGNPAPVEGIVWSVSDATLLTVTPAADGLSAVCEAVGPLGTAQVNVSADADMGSGVVTITGVLDIQIVAGQATSINIGSGAPEDK